MANIPYTALSASITLFSVRERVVEEREERVDFRKNIKVLTANPPYLLLTGGMFLFMIAVGMTASGVNYLFKYNLRAESSASLALLALLGTAGLFIPVYLLLANRTSKRLAFVAGMSILAAVLAALYFVSERGVGLTIGLFGTFFFFQQFGSAVALFLQGMGLHLVGYVANVEQSARSLAGIRLLMSLVPLAFV